MTDRDVLKPIDPDPADNKKAGSKGIMTQLNEAIFGRPPQERPKPVPFYTVNDIADALNVSSDTVYAMIHSGELQAVRFKADPAGKRYFYRISQGDFTAFMRKATYEPTTEDESEEIATVASTGGSSE